MARRTSLATATSLGYLVCMALWIYLIANTPRRFESPWDSDSVFFAALGLHFLVGFAIARLWALALPLAVAILSIPAGYAYGDRAGEFDFLPVVPIWAGILLASFFFVIAMMPGIFLGAWLRFRAASRPSQSSA